MKYTARLASGILLTAALLIISTSCKKEPEPPQLSTTAPEQSTTATQQSTTEAHSITTTHDPVTEPPHTHAFGEWIVEKEATQNAAGSRYRLCECGMQEREEIPKLPQSYSITTVVNGETKQFPVGEDGSYELPSSYNKVGYAFTGYRDENGVAFPSSGTTNASVTVYASFEILPTTTFAELKERMEAGADIKLSANISLEETIFVADKITLFASESYTLTRASDFFGDLFIVGCYSDGTNTILHGKTASLTIKPETNASITLDGNKDAMNGAVKGTAFLLKNSAEVNLYNGASIVNCKKTGNEYLIADDHNISDPALAGGAAVIITNGVFNMYGGAIRNCEVDMDDSSVTASADKTDGYDSSSRGGAIFNYGTFNMYGGVIENCSAGRGGAIYNYRIMYLHGGEVRNNHSASYGGAVYNPNSQYVYAVIGQPGTETKMTFTGNSAAKTGGAIFLSHQSTVYITGSTLFSQNQALDGNGGAINAAGALVIDYASFEKNTASSKGGAIYAYYNSPENTIRLVQIKSGLFLQNEAPRGGAIGFSCGDEVAVGAKGEIGNVIFCENNAPLTSAGKYGYGAALHIDQASDVKIYGSASFIDNRSDGNGAAIYVTKNSKLNILANENVTVTFKGNVTNEGNAGAIYNSGSPVTLQALNGGKILFQENAATTGNGGALAVHSGGTTSLYGVIFEGNSAPAGKGGALYIYGGHAIIGDLLHQAPSSFSQNAASKGGAIYISATDEAAASMSAHAIIAEKNSATDGGGAIYILATEAYSATLNITDLTVTENESAKNGGALYIYTAAQVTIGTLNATGNRTASGKNGGVAYISGKSQTTIHNLLATQNYAGNGGCIYLTTGNTLLTVNGGDITGNTADSNTQGNAIWVNSKNAVLMLKADSANKPLLSYTEGDILGDAEFTITTYQEDAQ